MRNILIADDSEPMRKLIDMILSRDGHHVTAVCNGAEALERMKERIFDLIITDLNMPILSGVQLIECVRRINRDIPILVCTTENQDIMRQRDRSPDASGWLRKPLQPKPLIDIVRVLLS